MNYVKSCLIITMLLGVGYSQCNESNWQDYYPDMAGCDLYGAYLENANLEGANLAYADLYFANLTNADLSGANFSYANLCNLAGSGWGEGEQPEGITDADGDGYDDMSYEVGYVAGAESGDLNLDGIDNVLDVVILVDNILNP